MLFTNRLAVTLSCAAVALGVPGCGKKPTGQVAAVVNGDEITLQEVSAEFGAGSIPESVGKNKLRAEVVQRLIDKRLLEQQARDAGLDRDPDFLVRRRQLEQALLLQSYAKRAQDTLRVPDGAAISKFIADNPYSFAKRAIFTVDQLRFPPLEKEATLAEMKTLHSLDAIATFLNRRSIKAARGTSKIDSAQIPAPLLKQILALPAGEPFIVPTPQGVVATVITGREAAPLVAPQAQPVAVQIMRAQSLEDLMKQRLKDARGTAQITYQPGFGPAASSTSERRI